VGTFHEAGMDLEELILNPKIPDDDDVREYDSGESDSSDFDPDAPPVLVYFLLLREEKKLPYYC
jgi:hypothetical protein